MEKYSPNWLLDKLNNSKTDAHKLMHIIDFQNNVGLHNVGARFKTFIESQKDIDPEIQKVINEGLWDLL